MRYRLFGSTGLRVAELALGTMTFGGESGWGAEKGIARQIFDAYAEAGGNFIDTANTYSNGTAERLVGEFIHADRERFVVATKFTLATRTGDPNANGSHRKNMVQALNASLKRLDTDYIDIYWVHIWDPLTPLDEMMRALDDQVRAGKILYLGISDAPAWVVARTNTLAAERGWTVFSGAQLQYSLVERNIERELLPMTKNLDITLIAWGVLGAGVLTGKYNTDPTGGGGRIYRAGWGPNDKRGSLNSRRLAIAEQVMFVAKGADATPSQVALSWVRSRSDTLIPLIGASKLDQLLDNLGCLDVKLSEQQVHQLDAASAIELGFPYELIRDDRSRLMGETLERIYDHRDTAV